MAAACSLKVKLGRRKYAHAQIPPAPPHFLSDKTAAAAEASTGAAAAVAIFAATCFALPDTTGVGTRPVLHGGESSDGEIALASFCCKGAAAMALL